MLSITNALIALLVCSLCIIWMYTKLKKSKHPIQLEISTEQKKEVVPLGKVDTTYENASGLTALMLAVKHNRYNTVKLLIKYNLNVNRQPYSGKTALMIASKMGNDKMVKLLLENGADINQKDREGLTALDYAQRDGKTSTVELLKQYQEKTDNNTIYEHPKIPERRVLPNRKTFDYKGHQELMDAVDMRDYKLVETALEKHIDINVRNGDGDTALMVATRHYEVKMVEFLLKNKADVNARNANGETALMIAAQNGDNDVIKALFEYTQHKDQTKGVVEKGTNRKIDTSAYEVQLLNNELSNKSAAAYLGVSASTLEHMRSRDKQRISRESIPCHYNSVRRVVYYKDALDAYKAKDWETLKAKRQEYKNEWQEVLGNKK